MKKAKKIIIIPFLILSMITGCSKVDNQQLSNDISQEEINNKIQAAMNAATYEEIFELFSDYYAKLNEINKKASIDEDDIVDSMMNKEVDENLTLYIMEYKSIGEEFKEKLEKLDIQDEELEKARNYFIKYIEHSNSSCDLLADGILTWNKSKITRAQTDSKNAEMYLKKALTILQEEIDIKPEDYSWSI